MAIKHTIISWFENKHEEQNLIDFFDKKKYNCISCPSKSSFNGLVDTAYPAVSLIILDLGLKETDAILACNELKEIKSVNSPFVVIISDKTEEFTQVTALDLGADDYIIKPIKPWLFIKRMEAILSRRPIKANVNGFSKKGFSIDAERHLVLIDNDPFELPKKEFELLNLFYSVPNKIFSREEIAIMLWNEVKIARQRTIDVHIRNIRRILGKNLIRTVKGLGYGLIQ